MNTLAALTLKQKSVARENGILSYILDVVYIINTPVALVPTGGGNFIHRPQRSSTRTLVYYAFDRNDVDAALALSTQKHVELDNNGGKLAIPVIGLKDEDDLKLLGRIAREIVGPDKIQRRTWKDVNKENSARSMAYKSISITTIVEL